MISPDELVEVLAHWKEARVNRLNDVEQAENLRCTVDIVAILSGHGVVVPGEVWKGDEPLPNTRGRRGNYG